MPSPGRARAARRGLTMALAGALAAGLAGLGGAPGCARSGLPPLDVRVLEANRQLWLAQGISSYNIDVIVSGTGLEEPETIHLEVRDNQVSRAERGGTPMTGEVGSYSVPGLFSTLARECELAERPESMGAPPGYRVYLHGRFDPDLGYPLHFRRIVGGSHRKVELRVTSFARR